METRDHVKNQHISRHEGVQEAESEMELENCSLLGTLERLIPSGRGRLVVESGKERCWSVMSCPGNNITTSYGEHWGWNGPLEIPKRWQRAAPL